MKFLEVRWKNIMCYGAKMQTIKFDDEASLWQIIGKNGHGKSTIITILKLGTYGEPGKNINLKDVANEINKSGYIYVKYESKGHIWEQESTFTPNGLKLLKDGEDVTGDFAGRPELRKYIKEEVLDIPFYIFNNTLSLSLNDFKSFIRMTPRDSRNIRDRIFGFYIINEMVELLKKSIKKYEMEIGEIGLRINGDIENLDNSRSKYDSLKATATNENDIKISALEEQLRALEEKKSLVSKEGSELQKSITEIGEKLQTYAGILKKRKSIADIKDFLIYLATLPNTFSSLTLEKGKIQEAENDLSDKQNKILQAISKKESEIGTLGKKLAVYEKGKCPTCESDLTTDSNINLKLEMTEELSVLETKLLEFKKVKERVASAVQKLNKSKESLTKVQSSYFDTLATGRQTIMTITNNSSLDRFKMSDAQNKVLDFLGKMKAFNFDGDLMRQSIEILNGLTLEINQDEKDLDIDGEISKFEKKLAELQQTKGGLNQNLSDLSNEISGISGSISGLRSAVVVDESSSILSLIEDIEKKIRENQDVLAKSKKAKGYLDIINEILGESGVKAHMMKEIIPAINHEIANILSQLDINLGLTFDEEFSPMIIRFGREVNIATISIGQEKKLDLSVLIAMTKIIKMKYHDINVIFYDEIFSSIHKEDVSVILDIIKKVCCVDLNLNTFVINHAHLSSSEFDYIAEAEYLENFSNLYVMSPDEYLERLDLVETASTETATDLDLSFESHSKIVGS